MSSRATCHHLPGPVLRRLRILPRRSPHHLQRSGRRAPGQHQSAADLQWRPVSQFANLGGFAEQMLVHEHAVGQDRPGLSARSRRDHRLRRLHRLGSVLKSASVKPGSTVAVVGGGGVGLSAVQGARIAGARRIFLVDIQPEKFDLARKAGATDCVNPADGDPVKQIRT